MAKVSDDRLLASGRRPKSFIALLVLFLFLVFIRFKFVDVTILRLSIYTFPFAAGFFLLHVIALDRDFLAIGPAHKFILSNIYLYGAVILSSFITLFLRDELYSQFFKEAFFILSPLFALLLVFFFYKPGSDMTYSILLFWGFAVTYLIKTNFGMVQALPDIVRSLSQVAQRSDLGGQAESGLAFAFGLFFVFFFLQRNLRYSALATIFLLSSYKRIAFVAVLAAAVSYLFMRPISYRRFRRIVPWLAVLVNLILVFIIIGFANGDFD